MGATGLSESSTVLDWASLAGVLLERAEEPTLLLSRQGEVTLANRAIGELLETRREDLVGRQAASLFPGLDSESGAWPLEAAFFGGVRELETTADAPNRGGLEVSFQVSPVGTGSAASLVAVVRRVRRRIHGATSAWSEAHYEVWMSPGRAGELKRVWDAESKPGDDLAEGELCYRGLYQRDNPCPGCPVFTPSAPLRSSVGVTRPRGRHDDLRVVSIESTAKDSVAVRSHVVTDALLGELMRAKVDALAERGALTERERSVLWHLLLGGSVVDIGDALGISPRTVKFHQSNLLDKLGAESRVDLTRILL
jgi:DNA-binding CsgD family transcriptional regulator